MLKVTLPAVQSPPKALLNPLQEGLRSAFVKAMLLGGKSYVIRM